MSTTPVPGESLYRDRWIECTDSGIVVHGYYFPWGTKHIAYSSVRAVRRVEMGVFTGQARIWGTSNPRYWANLDPERPKKKVGLILDLGRHVKPYITPDDADAVLAIIRRRSNLTPGEAHGESERGPFV